MDQEKQSEYIIEVQNLVRDYVSHKGVFRKKKHTVRAVNNLSFFVKKGEIFGLLGANGAGKTTTIKILTTLLAPTSGSVSILGLDPMTQAKALRPRISFVFGGERSLYWRITGRENLNYFSDLYHISNEIKKRRIPELLELVGLKDHADERVETYSKGMKQRLQIARCLVNDPEIIFLDEPTIGLDPIGARDLRNIVKMLAKQGKTVLITTHYMYEADEICGRVAIVNKGKLVALDTPANLKAQTEHTSVIELHLNEKDDALLKGLNQIKEIDQIRANHTDQYESVSLQCKEPRTVFPQLFPLIGTGHLLSVRTREATLEDVYIHYVSQSPH
ncbi:ABC transporter ATP-binding protein [Sporolactobacillus shoreae]|uniref:ABC transporter ATP-binding protein n=1 Tax=Sporolactobacillus shoreae TaxID=1465501 RepID=A0A4Z0GJV8_9BACL|nr:ABC transporter ATP-binding protein [Sporolactobacillus shoreae]TGA96599.1 ABC transporter ATP-binding protein [Sporolactobacillus shoreae]